jgi:hypothetical protein
MRAVFAKRRTAAADGPNVGVVRSSEVRGWAMVVAAIGLLAPSVAWAITSDHAEGAALPPVRMSKIQYDPPGADDGSNTSLNKEYVQVHNFGAKAWTLSGWSVRDVTGYKFRFPDGFTLQPGDTVTLHTGAGKNRPLHLYWGQGSYIWNNTGDKATFKNAAGKVVDTCAYAGDGSYVTC